jgi:hypothetical protein
VVALASVVVVGGEVVVEEVVVGELRLAVEVGEL